MAEGKDEKPINLKKHLSDSDTLDDKPINPKLKTSVEGDTMVQHQAWCWPLRLLVIHVHKQTLLWSMDPAIQKQSKG